MDRTELKKKRARPSGRWVRRRRSAGVSDAARITEVALDIFDKVLDFLT